MTTWRDRAMTATAVAVVLVAGGALAAGIRNALFETAPVRAGSFTPAIDLGEPEADEEFHFGLDTSSTSAVDTTTTSVTSSTLATTAATAVRSRVTTTSTAPAVSTTTSTTIAATTTTTEDDSRGNNGRGRGRGGPDDD